MKVPGAYKHMLVCKDCPLHKTRTQVVVGRGSTRAKYMLIGEAPGENEDKEGEPFVGSAGKKLEELFEQSGLSLNDFYITNSVKCRPPKNRRPVADEIKACSNHLRLQMGTIHPEMIIICGGTALQYFCPDEKISDAHGKLVYSKRARFNVYPIIHPAAIFRNPEWEEVILKDLKKLKKILTKKKEDPEPMFGPQRIIGD